MKEIEGTLAVSSDGTEHFIPDWLWSVIDEIAETYKLVCTAKYIRKPKAYSVYEAWKKLDKKERERTNEPD